MLKFSDSYLQMKNKTWGSETQRSAKILREYPEEQ